LEIRETYGFPYDPIPAGKPTVSPAPPFPQTNTNYVNQVVRIISKIVTKILYCLREGGAGELETLRVS